MAEMQQAPDLSQAQETQWMTGGDWLLWRSHPKTQEVLKWLKFSVGTAQDRWANGGFSTWESTLFAQGGANALGRLMALIENIKLEPETAQKDGNDEK